MTNMAKFLRKLRIDNDQSLGEMAKIIGLSAAYLSAIENDKRNAPEDMKEKVFQNYNLSDEQKLEFARVFAESRKKVEIGLKDIQQENLPEYVDTAVMFAQDLSQMNSEQLAKIKEFLQSIKTETKPK